VSEAPELFEPARDFPDPAAADRYASLVGLDDVKKLLHKEGLVRLDPQRLAAWSSKHHGGQIAALAYFRSRPPLFVFAGDVGTGKTQLAETFGDRLATESGLPIGLRKMTLNARGSGRVGEMTSLISSAFAEVEREAQTLVKGGRSKGGIVLLIDEADALAQSRELEQMHHEDRAGVNALIRGVDHIAQESLPVLVVACTNRLDALDPGLRRRAAQTFAFGRPSVDQREAVLTTALEGLDLSAKQIRDLAVATGGGHNGRDYGPTYSDLTQRLVPLAVLDAYPTDPLTFARLMAHARALVPTAPFRTPTS
jgi:SpoVK/Ycf46/Vps4 family AAA+-type ATPase